MSLLTVHVYSFTQQIFVENEHGKNGHTYNKRDAFCLETQVEPNAVNVEDFHSPILNAGEQYDSVTAYHFYIIK